MFSLTLVFLCLTAAGCAPREGRSEAQRLSTEFGFAPLKSSGGPYVVQAWLRPGMGRTLRVYIEGDGFAWRTRSQPSRDPTPRKPMGFALAAADPASGPVAYLGRPCQYVEGEDRRICQPALWTSDRYGEATVRSLDAAVNELKTMAGADTLMLFGYSGGGALAALLAERRDDVVFLGTVAGNLEVKNWTSFHQVSPLTGSLDPASEKMKTLRIPQVHVVGQKDEVVPPRFAQSWCEALPGCKVVIVPDMAHSGEWNHAWPGLLEGELSQYIP